MGGAAGSIVVFAAETGFGGLALTRQRQVRFHCATSALAVVRTKRVVDGSMQVGGFLEILALGRRLATMFVEDLGHHLHERREDRIARRGRDGAMEADVVHEERLRVVHRRVHAGDLLGDRRQLIAGGTLGSQSGDADLEDAARFEHLVAREPVQRREEAERLAAEGRWAAADERARAVARLHDTHGRQRTQAGADAGPTHADAQREFALGWQPGSGAEVTALDQLTDVTDDELCGDTLERFLGGL